MRNRHASCVLCGVTFTPPGRPGNQAEEPHRSSLEHIFPAALGGSWAEHGLICKACNDWSGHALDHHLATLFRPLVAILGIRHSREGHIQAYEYQQDGQKIILDSMSGRLFDLSLHRPTQTAPGTLEMSVGPGQDAYVARTMKRYATKKLGWDVKRLGDLRTITTEAPTGTTPIMLDFADFERDEVKAAIGKIALLGTAALLGAQRFSQIDSDPLRQSVRLERPGSVVTAPDGAPMLSRFGHGLTLHVLEDGRLTALVTLFGACSFLVPVGAFLSTWPVGTLPGKVILPTDERVIVGPSPQIAFGTPNVGRAMAALDQLHQEMQPYILEQAANRRAWTAAGFPGQPGDIELDEAQVQMFLKHQEREFQIAGVG